MKSRISFCLMILLLACSDDTPDKQDVKPSPKKDTTIFNTTAQNPYEPVDLSPIDISYFPVDYPIRKMTKKITTLPVARVIYGRPHKQGRKIFGNLLKYGEPWRLGANEATEIEFFQTVSIQDKKIIKGRFVLYCIPFEKHWTVVFNNNVFSWGLKPDSKMDVYRFDVPVEKSTTPIEHFTMVFEKSFDGGTDLLMTWDDVLVRLPIKF